MTDQYAPAEGLGVTLEGGVLRLRLDRADKRNALTDDMMRSMIDAIDTAGRDEAVRVIVISAAGEHFCSGFDIVSRNAGDAPRPRVGSIQRRLPSTAHRLVPLILTTQTPVVCRVQGWCAGIGLNLALAADFTIAADDTRFWMPFVDRGFTPDSGATWLLPRRIGDVRAREMLLLARVVEAPEASQWGMVHQVLPTGEVDDAVERLVGTLARSATVAVGLTKWLLNSGREQSLLDHHRNEAFAMELSSRSEDFREGLAAFQEKRDPDFKGR